MLEVATTGVATGGDGIARHPDGRIAFVEGALPGERLQVEVVDDRRDYVRARIVEVLEAAPGRMAPPCPNVARGCGGCGWQHVRSAAQRQLKEHIVAEALRRTGRLSSVPHIAFTEPAGAPALRTTVRLAPDPATSGRLAYRGRRSTDLVVPVTVCGVLHPALEELVLEGRFGSAPEVTVRISVATGERMVVTPAPAEAVVAPDVVIVDAARPGRAALQEDVDGVRLRVSARSFFQSGPAVAEALVSAVRRALADDAVAGATVVDAYAGVGLFSATVLRAASAVVAIESSPDAIRDARANLGANARVIRCEVGRWRPQPADIVVADPARTGLGRPGMSALLAAKPHRVVLVSCDAGSLGRDARLLADAGYELTGVEVVDAFPYTPHVEVVTGYSSA